MQLHPIDTHLNWGASYLVNDLYRRFLRPDETERRYVTVSRLAVAAAGLFAVWWRHVRGR